MISIEGLTRTYAGQSRPAVEDLCLTQEPGTFLTLLGPSGCGKSTTLRSLAGLESPDAGRITIGGRPVFSSADRVDLPPSRRGLGMVAQSYAVWPHLTVAQNVEYPLKRRKVARAERRRRVADVLEQVGLADFADRPTPALSGGQQQRVALARAIVCEPDVLLLDEPLSNLDARLRRELGTYLRDLQRRLGLSVVYVTHDQDEALAMSDVVVLMDRGEILENGAPEDIYASPRTLHGATFVGSANHLVATAARRDGDGWTAESVLGPVRFVDPHGSAGTGRVDLVVRPEEVLVSPVAQDLPVGVNHGRGVVVHVEFRGMYWETVVRFAGGSTMTARTHGRRWWDLQSEVVVSFPASACKSVRDTASGGTDVDAPVAEVLSPLTEQVAS